MAGTSPGMTTSRDRGPTKTAKTTPCTVDKSLKTLGLHDSPRAFDTSGETGAELRDRRL
jgi:hypothetical protein